MRREAERLGAQGWVRNRSDGSVEALVQGSPEIIEALLAWSYKGPPAALVSAVETIDLPYDPGLQDFSRWPTE
jgi:acylphosphatase